MLSTGGSNIGYYDALAVAPSSDGFFNFAMPSDLSSIYDIRLLGVISPGAALTNRDIDLYSDYASIAENYSTHSQSDTTSTYDLSTYSDKIYGFDLSGIVTNIVADDLLGIRVAHNDIGGAIRYLGIRLKYISL